jgi:hypothetical protein
MIGVDDLLHALYCCGQQGAREAAINDVDDALYGEMGDVPFEVGSPTSAAAAESITDEDLSRLEARVFDEIARAPQTCDALEVATGLSHQTTSARIRGLVLRDRIIDSGYKQRTRSGRWAVVWRVRTAEDAAVQSVF